MKISATIKAIYLLAGTAVFLHGVQSQGCPSGCQYGTTTEMQKITEDCHRFMLFRSRCSRMIKACVCATPGTIPTASSPTTTRTENKAEKGVRSSIKKPSTKPLHKIATPGTIPTASSPTTTRTENKAEKGVRSSIKKPSTKPLHKIATHETTTGTENMTEKRTRWPIESTTLHIKAAKGVSPTPRKMTMLPKTKPSGLEDICKTRPKDEFHLPYPPDPSKFVQCDITGRAYLRSCGDLTVWDNTFKACVGKQMF
ncbi:uncharacterized protein LOC117330916 isoform X1 [Pecten maximus]|uniref:uncharacterized protein LOC117330916 isoform X1 n=1 Tax=Pecten maximus TaxID=6579 RepID=UPI001457FB94|nr:uncharacterized protein LOC117330916 isoform X1 [Pecten maximus]